MTTSKPPSKVISVRLRPTDQRRLRQIIVQGKAGGITDAVRYGLKVATERPEAAA